jgi:hypothetical protein
MRMDSNASAELHQAAERLAQEFNALPVTTVIATLSDCVDAWPNADTAFIEQAARARLADGN